MLSVAIALIGAMTLAACSSKQTAAPTSAAKSTQPKGDARGRMEAKAIAVVATTLQLSEFAYETEALGTAKSNEAVDITAKTTNRVVAIHFREGQEVREGAVLVEFDGAEARANLAAAEASLKDNDSLYKRSRELFNTKALAESQLEQLEANMLTSKAQVDAARARVNDTVILAPFSGRVGLRNVSVGSLVTPGQVITSLDDIHIIKLDFTVPETYLAGLQVDQLIEAKSASYADYPFPGRIGSIATRVDPVSRSIMVRALVDNRDQRLKPGMFMTVHLKRSTGKALLVPEQALVPESSQQFVFVVRDGAVSKVAVTIGRRKPGQVEVQQGLNVGDVIVVEGGEKLREGSKVTIAQHSSSQASV